MTEPDASVASASQSSSGKAATENNSEAELLTRIDSLAAAEAEAGLLSGVILVARGDRILLQRAYGFAGWELRAPATATTRFGLGSITNRSPNHAVFPSERVGAGGDTFDGMISGTDPNTEVIDLKTAWTTARSKSGVRVRWHDV